MNKCPLLLKYRLRDCYYNQEIDINRYLDTQCLNENLQEYDKPKHEIWRLQLPDGSYYSTEFGGAMYSKKYEFLAAGDPKPVAVCFANCITGHKINRIHVQKYCLPAGYIRRDYSFWNTRHCLIPLKYVYYQKILQEYERYRTEWQTRIIVVEYHT